MPRGARAGAAVAIAALLACARASAPAPARADEPHEPGHRVSFRVESAREVPNDWIRAVVGALEEDADPARAAERVNRTMAWALEQARAESRVKARSGGYRTEPVTEEGKVRRWRASQDLALEGSDSAAMTALLGTLQGRLQLRSFQFTVSDAQRERVEQELVKEALAAFRARADLVRQSLGAHAWTLDQLSIETGAGGPVPAMAMEMRVRSSAPPAVEAGTSRLSVGVAATIALE
jgi:predicted secreted protein